MKKGDLVWALGLASVVFVFAWPGTAKPLLELTSRHAYLMGFVKFALLATMGELLVLRLARGDWSRPRALPARILIWGLVGLLVVLMFALFTAGVAGAGAKGLLPRAEGWLGSLLAAFFTSALMNLTFGPVFMAAHRMSDAWLDGRAEGRSFAASVAAVDWQRFLDFVLARTIPLFWIPAHTLTFLLPSEYRVLVAALLSIALGIILTWGKRAAGGAQGR
jgi:hypothetical protein